MKQKLLMMLAALMLMGTSAMAQTNGDVNGDGKVDEQDITAIIQIMQEAGGVKEQTKYYWYAGWTEPSAQNISSIVDETYPVSSTNTTMNKAGGSTIVITGYTKEKPLFFYDALYYSTAKTYHYLVLPDGIGVWDSEGEATLLDTFDLLDNIVIPHHKVYKSQETTRNIGGLLLF